MTLDEFRLACEWSKSEMARQANIDYVTFNRAVTGNTITANSADKLARAISKKLGRPIHASDIEGLNIKA